MKEKRPPDCYIILNVILKGVLLWYEKTLLLSVG